MPWSERSEGHALGVQRAWPSPKAAQTTAPGDGNLASWYVGTLCPVYSLPHRVRHEVKGHARFVTFSCYQRLPLLGRPELRDAFAAHLEAARLACGFKLIAWVVMPEHVHLLMLPSLPAQPLPSVLRRIKEPMARQALARWKELGAPVLPRLTDSRGGLHFWQRGGGYDRNIYSAAELNEKIRYIEENPVRRGLVGRTVEWEWSSAKWRAGEQTGPVQLDQVR